MTGAVEYGQRVSRIRVVISQYSDRRLVLRWARASGDKGQRSEAPHRRQGQPQPSLLHAAALRQEGHLNTILQCFAGTVPPIETRWSAD